MLNEEAPSRSKSPFTNKPVLFIRCAMHILRMTFPDGGVLLSVQVSKTNMWRVRGPSINWPNRSGGCCSLLFVWPQSDRLEDLVDECNVKMRSQANSVVSPACERRQPLAPREMGKPINPKGDLASTYSKGGSAPAPHDSELCFLSSYRW